jgi:type IV secretory pathway VirB2 component (pilin)
MPLVIIFLGVMLLFGPPTWAVGVVLIIIGAVLAVLR